ncbi:uncharacterized protein CIMG_03031 [Coccidioides immitis RS]|uniref:NmrA-like domain-containing protein n=1 Tax=Coccidioides immitis (strain RS) TaxID=246410 RepID=J3KAG0_COCIM|nr:uncharacterized protein CIMG_03031 [Coccidioides immitis RS]EAS32007.3 hypothetical protein CIMG_03031 [Coccidioides immitis RS]
MVHQQSSHLFESILDGTNATALFSFLHSNDPRSYNTAQEAMLAASRASKSCRRFVPSDYGGDIDRFPGLPRFYEPTHRAFRENILRHETEIEWTAANHGWFMDYFVQGSKVDPTTLPYGFSGRSPATAGQGENDNNSKDIDFSIPRSYMKPLPGIWPLDLDSFTATRLGTGNEAIGWTSARDVARALVRLVQAPAGSWEKHTYVAGEIGTWYQAISKVEKFLGRKFVVVDPPSE